jgi:hypothetical protein
MKKKVVHAEVPHLQNKAVNYRIKSQLQISPYICQMKFSSIQTPESPPNKQQGQQHGGERSE